VTAGRSVTRRQFLKGSAACTALTGTALLTGLDHWFAATALAEPAGPGDYRALVCVFLFGGNDANNMIVPLDEYGQYQAVRGGAQFALRTDQLLEIAPPSHGRRFGLHPGLARLHPLWAAGHLGAVVNVGTLVEPLTRARFLAGAPRPRQLFSHSDQQLQHQTSVAEGSSATGWGGRLADRLGDPAGFPTITAVGGGGLFGAGAASNPLVITPAPTTLGNALPLSSTEPGLERLLGTAHGTYAAAADGVMARALRHRASLSGDPALTTAFPATTLGNQLKQIAKVLALRPILGLSRQVFVASLGGFDTHTSQSATQGQLLTQLGDGLAAFHAATVELGIASSVTTFTLSDFSRTFKPGGGQTGTDHAWGSHQLVLGGDVRGGDFAGTFPTLAADGPDDTDTGSGARGRWIPTTAVDQYAATLARWFGVAAEDLPLVFPALDRFATGDLGFLGVTADRR
jgi:uncharacterized protein (DUF1501 family)